MFWFDLIFVFVGRFFDLDHVFGNLDVTLLFLFCFLAVLVFFNLFDWALGSLFYSDYILVGEDFLKLWVLFLDFVLDIDGLFRMASFGPWIFALCTWIFCLRGFEVGFGWFGFLCLAGGLWWELLEGNLLFLFLFNNFRLDSYHSVFAVHFVLIKLRFGFGFIIFFLFDNLEILIDSLTLTELFFSFYFKSHKLNNFINRLLFNRFILFQIARVVLRITGKYIDNIPALIRYVQSRYDNRN